MRTLALALGAAILAASPAAAQLVPVATTVTADGQFQGDIAFANDGVFPADGAFYRDNSVHDYGGTIFTYTFAAPTTISALKVTVDNNDDYEIQLTNGGVTFLTFRILASQGNVPVFPGGFETFTSDPSLGGNFLTTLEFAPFLATSATIRTGLGDGFYGIGEAQFYAQAVPEPASWALMIAGVGLAGGALRTRGRRVAMAG